MNISAIVFVVATVLSSTAIAETAPDEEAVWQLEQDYWEYVKNNDREGYRTLWDEDFVGWPSFSKSPLGKANIADWIAPLHSDPTWVYDYELTKGAVRAFGDVVVAHYLVTDFLRSTETGEMKNVLVERITHTWRRHGDSWQIITGMSGSWVGEYD